MTNELKRELDKKLGFGCMRLPVLNGDNEQIDDAQFCKMIDSFLEQGFMYFDTAYPYHNEKSEAAVRRCLVERHERSSFYLADKMPVWLIKNEEDYERIFQTQLERCGVEYFDFYLLHAMNRERAKETEEMGGFDFVRRMKAEGKIRHIGFSFHDELPLFRQIVDTMDWDFCQIQLNYIDTCHQAGLAGLRYAAEKGMAVSIMEPLRGGFLVHPPKAVADLLASHGRTPVQFGLEYLWRKPEVSAVLSGMGTSAQIDENIGYLSHPAEPLAEDELEQLAGQAAALLRAGNLIGCTGCRYCAPGCPAGIPIPQYFQCYDAYLHGNDDATKDRYRALKASGVGTVQQCLLCHQCEKICPQHIAIPEWLKKVDRLLR